MRRNRVSYPWSLGRGYGVDRDARSVLIIPQVAGAGLLAGDHFRQTISVAPGAALKLVSAGATLVHGAPSPRASTSSWRYRLGASAKAVIVQEPHVLMQGADLTLCQDLVLHEDAIFIAGDIFAFADGVTSAAWAAQTSVSRPDGTIVFTDRTKASGQDLVRTARLPGSVAAFATVLVLAPKAFVPELMRALERPIASLDPRLWGACAPLRRDAGVGIRLAAPEGGQLRDLVLVLIDQADALCGRVGSNCGD